jgi:hypothetical protein
VERSRSIRPAPYIDGPAQLQQDAQILEWEDTGEQFRQYLNTPEAGTTRLVELMANAGQGKTFLLEQLAHTTATAYVPDDYPQPFLLIVDLLGRYVGTIDDALAGALANTYRFPGLSQRDIALAISQRWIHLALDGFDELAARIGPRDAFLRVTELLDQLQNSGTVILSARSAFFELYQISSAVRSYLKPQRGSYSTALLRLGAWSPREGALVFARLGSLEPDRDLQGLLDAFGGDSSLILQPFFLTRLAALWKSGERFADAAEKRDPQWRTAYIIGELVEREATTKWTDPHKNEPILTADQHATLLEGVAEEMWRAGTFRLSAEELRIAAQLALSDLQLPQVVAQGVEDRIATHAAFIARDRGFSFIHDRFFHYYLGRRLASLLHAKAAASLQAVLEARELPPEVCDWANWMLRTESGKRTDAVSVLQHLRDSNPAAATTESNAGLMIARLLHDAPQGGEVRGIAFLGDGFRGRAYTNVRFVECAWWQADLLGATFVECEFDHCTFGDIAIDEGTSFARSKLVDCEFQGMDLRGERQVFDPARIVQVLQQRGALVHSTHDQPHAAPLHSIDQRVLQGLAKLVRKAERSCDFTEQDVTDYLPHARQLLKLGIEAEVLRHSNRITSGPHKEFLRFRVDRQLFLRGEAQRTGDDRIDRFWDELQRLRPAKRA